MNRTVVVLTFAWLAIPAMAANPGGAYPVVASEEPRQRTPAEVARAVDAWLSCYECDQGELGAVVASGAAAAGPLGVAADRGEVQTINEKRAALQRTYDRIADHASTVGRDLNISEDEYVRRKLEAFVSLRAARARKALDLIGGPPVEP